MEFIKKFMEFEFFTIGSYTLSTGILVGILLTIVITKLALWIIKKVLFRSVKRNRFEIGNMHSLFQIIKYVFWIIAVLLILDLLGLKLNVILAGSAALLVGVGLGLQNTFNDFISGIILLFEGSVKVGDILEIDNDVVEIKRIGMRTSHALNRDDIVSILPNSLITNNKVINWTHQSRKTRFRIKVGVAYGSNVDVVVKCLVDSALEHSGIKTDDAVIARFIDFGNSSLDFELLFFSNDIFRIEHVKSEIRKTINKKFIENNITIPFPQMDLHLKTDLTK